MQKYKTATAFRKALEDRLKGVALKESIPLDRLRKRIAFDRLLARLFHSKNPIWILKGGYAIEFRLQNIARATKDIDFSIPHMIDPTSDKVLQVLQKEVETTLDDGFTFLIGTPMLELDQALYGGWRFPVESRLDNRTFAKFHLDVGVGDAIISDPDWTEGSDFLNFAGIPPAKAALLPKEQHLAEKIHAYTLPREERLNSRTRDLVDLVLLIEQDLPEKEKVKEAVNATFNKRKSHTVPAKLNPPPEIWREAYTALAAECGVTKKTMNEAFELVNEFWNKLEF